MGKMFAEEVWVTGFGPPIAIKKSEYSIHLHSQQWGGGGVKDRARWIPGGC